MSQRWNQPPPDLPGEAVNVLVIERLFVGFLLRVSKALLPDIRKRIPDFMF